MIFSPEDPLPHDISVSRDGVQVTVFVTGELDIDTAPTLKDCFDRLIERGETTIRVNLRWLTFCDSIGISAFVHGYEACRAAGGRLSVTDAQGAVARVMELTGVLPLLSVDPDPVTTADFDWVPVRDADASPAEAPGTRSGTLRLEIDVRDEDGPDRSIIAAPSQDDITDALRSLDRWRDTRLTIHDGGGAHLTVEGGRGRYHVHIGAPERDASVVPVDVDLEQAAAAVQRFVRTGRPDPDLEWHSPDDDAPSPSAENALSP